MKMRIKRYHNFCGTKEKVILEMFNAKVIGCDDNYELYYTETEAFWFLDSDDENLKFDDNRNAFTYNVPNSKKKNCLVGFLRDRGIVVLVTEGQYPNYSFYGVYRLDEPYIEGPGNGVVVEAYVPLSFKLVRDVYEVV